MECSSCLLFQYVTLVFCLSYNHLVIRVICLFRYYFRGYNCTFGCYTINSLVVKIYGDFLCLHFKPNCFLELNKKYIYRVSVQDVRCPNSEESEANENSWKNVEVGINWVK